jgi:hypothetical protein
MPSLTRLLRAVLIGVAVFAAWTLLPALWVRWHTAPPAVPWQDTQPEPIYRDADGRRIGEADHQLLLGARHAAQAGITRHADCKVLTDKTLRAGCHRHVTEAKHLPPHIDQGDWTSGKSRAQCEAEVDAFWAPRVADQDEQGWQQAARSWTKRDWLPERERCRNYEVPAQAAAQRAAPVQPAPVPAAPASPPLPGG